MIGEQLTGSTNSSSSDHIFIWDASSQRYDDLWKDKDGQWHVGGVTSKPAISAGSAFFIRNNQSYTQQFYFSGEILIDEEYSIILSPVYNHIGYPYSTSIRAEDTFLSTFVTDVVERISIGEAFWVKVTNDTPIMWVEKSPYRTEVFSRKNTYPRIKWIKGGNEEVSICIENNESLDAIEVYFQDISTNKFNPYRNWSALVRGYGEGQKQITIKDRIPAEKLGRYYLVIKDGIIPAGIESGAISLEALAAGYKNTTGETSLQTDTLADSESGEVSITIQGGRIIYVDGMNGRDTYSGMSSFISGNHGPKKTIKAGLATVPEDGVLIIKGGVYHEDLDVSGRKIKLQLDGDILLQRSEGDIK